MIRFAVPRHHRRRWTVIGVVPVVIAAGALAVGLAGRPDPPTGSTVTGGTIPSSPPASPTMDRSVPVALRIPAIDVAVPLITLGLNPDGTVEVPTDYADAGWFRLGPTPGQLGSAVILGHVDSHRGPAVFHRLRLLRHGDRVEVRLASGTVNRFAVRTVATYLKERFPARKVYGSHGYSALQLVTCGGSFDARTRSYRSNVVVYTTLVGTEPTVPAVPGTPAAPTAPAAAAG